MTRATADARFLLSPGLAEAPVMDALCSHFVLTLTLHQAGRFNLRRDWNSLLGLVGRHLVWPAPVLERVRAFLRKRCKNNPQWKGHELLSDESFVKRYGPWRGPYEEGTLFFYIDEYIKDAPKDLLARNVKSAAPRHFGNYPGSRTGGPFSCRPPAADQSGI